MSELFGGAATYGDGEDERSKQKRGRGLLALLGQPMTGGILPRGDSLNQRIDRRLHGVSGLVTTLVGDDEDTEVVLRDDVDIALRTGHAAMVGVVSAFQAVAADDVPEIADAELGIEVDQRTMGFLYDGPVGQLESQVLRHFRNGCFHVS